MTKSNDHLAKLDITLLVVDVLQLLLQGGKLCLQLLLSQAQGESHVLQAALGYNAAS